MKRSPSHRKRPVDQPVLLDVDEHVGAYPAAARSSGRDVVKTAPPNYCAWQGCRERVPRSRLMCAQHWYQLPNGIREAITRNYVAGQEERGDASPKYLRIVGCALRWIVTDGPGPVVSPAVTPDVDGRTEATT